MLDREREGIWKSALDELPVTETDSLFNEIPKRSYFFLSHLCKKGNIFKIVVQGMLGGIFGSHSSV
jgi:hypothetical protein